MKELALDERMESQGQTQECMLIDLGVDNWFSFLSEIGGQCHLRRVKEGGMDADMMRLEKGGRTICV